VGLAARLNGDFLDGMKKTIALAVIHWRFEDATLYTYADPRIAAIVAAVPYAADFDMGSLAAPRVPLALVTADRTSGCCRASTATVCSRHAPRANGSAISRTAVTARCSRLFRPGGPASAPN